MSTDASRTRPLRVLIAGGGTGGHLFPGIAVAGAFVRRIPDTKTLFVVAGRPFERQALSRAGFPYKTIAARGIKGTGVLRKLAAGMRVPVSLVQSFFIVGRFSPDIAVGVGGYASGPAVLAARVLGVPTAVCEQNKLPGVTNRILARVAHKVLASFEGSFDTVAREKVTVTGNPVRPEIAALGKRDRKAPDKNRPFTVLVLGGSQGARSVNRAMMEAAGAMSDRDGMFIIHQTGPDDTDAVRTAYENAGVKAEVAPFFVNVAARYEKADLLVCRAGATTVAEITAAGLPAIFIPFPYAADDHQAKNALALAEAGAAEVILEKDLTGEKLARAVERLAREPETLARMADRAAALGRPDAADDIVDICLTLAESGRTGAGP